MSDNTSFDKILFQALKTGCTAVLSAVVLLVPAAMLIERGVIGERSVKAVAIGCLALTAMLNSLFVSKDCGGVISSLAGTLVMVLLIVLMSAAMKQSEWTLRGLVPATAVGFFGSRIGVLVKPTKTTHKRGRRKR